MDKQQLRILFDQMIATDGWKYVTNWLDTEIENNMKRLHTTEANLENLPKLQSYQASIKAYNKLKDYVKSVIT